jgi:metaxin
MSSAKPNGKAHSEHHQNGKSSASSVKHSSHSNGASKPAQHSTSPSHNGNVAATHTGRQSFLSRVFTIPPPIKHLFETFPLVVLPANSAPIRTAPVHYPTSSSGHVLFTWTTSSDSRIASFNPTCLAWQLFLRSRKVPFATAPSSNHAAAGERLPLLLVNSLETEETRNPWIGSKIGALKEKTELKELGTRDLAVWAADAADGWPTELESVYAPYKSLLDNELRRAWVRIL